MDGLRTMADEMPKQVTFTSRSGSYVIPHSSGGVGLSPEKMHSKPSRFSLALILGGIHLLLVGFALAGLARAIHSHNVDSSFEAVVAIFVFYILDYPLGLVFESLQPYLDMHGGRTFAEVVLFAGFGSAMWFLIGWVIQALFARLVRKRSGPNGRH